MRVVPAVEFGDRLGIAFAGLCLDQDALLKMRFKKALQRYKKSRAIVTVPVCIAARHNLSVVYLNLHLRIAR